MNNLKDIKWYATVKVKMISLLILTMTIVTVIIGILSYGYIKTAEETRLNQFANVTADRLSKGLETPIWNIDREQVSDILETELGESSIVGIVVNDQGGQGILSAKGRDRGNQVIDYSGPFGSNDIQVTRNIIREGNNIGSLDIYVSQEQLKKDLSNFATGIIVLILVLAIAIFVLMNILLSTIVIKPLLKLASTADAISLGQLDENFEIKSEDEIGFLANSFKKMQVSLRIAMKRISKKSEEPAPAVAPQQKSTFDAAVIQGFVQQIKSVGKFPSLPSIFKIASKANTVPDDLVDAAWKEWKKQN